MRIRTAVAAAAAAIAIALTGYTVSTASDHNAEQSIVTGCPTTNPPSGDRDVTTYNDGWIDGCADTVGDDNRNGKLEPGEAGWACRHTQLADLRACLTRAYGAARR